MKLTRKQVWDSASKLRGSCRKLDQACAIFLGPGRLKISAYQSPRYQYNVDHYQLVGFYDASLDSALLMEDLEYIGVEIA